ncbi:MAG: SulP family inorganic anion transporter [Leptolyngbyaceae cyanobacterium MO_188.B28]|nr:SulP family inorganic anion transporter [Leptolyngbyaceae cyanobacterium MO_188.B28]
MNKSKRPSPQTHLGAWICHELHPSRLIVTLTAGMLSGVLIMIYSISIATLIFSGQLAPFISVGFGLVFLSTIVIAPLVAFTNSLPGVIAGPQDAPAIVLAIMASEIVSQFPNNASASLPTVIMSIALTTVLVGGVFFLLGTFQLGSLIRCVPYPVIGGFLAGTGYLFIQGAFNVMTDQSLGWLQAPFLLQPAVLIRWVPGLGVALALLICLRRNNNPLIMPSIFAGFTALFYLVLGVTQTSIESARQVGLLMAAFPEGGVWPPLNGSILNQVDWRLIVGQSGHIATTVLLSVVLLLLTVSGIELVTRQEVDLNQELRSAGLANLIVGLSGGTVGFHSLSISTLNCVRIGVKSRLVGVLVTLLCWLTWVGGDRLIALFPKPLLGGVLLYLGLSFLVEWVYHAWFRLSKAEYAIVTLIFFTIATVGFLPGVCMGLLASICRFAIRSL